MKGSLSLQATVSWGIKLLSMFIIVLVKTNFIDQLPIQHQREMQKLAGSFPMPLFENRKKCSDLRENKNTLTGPENCKKTTRHHAYLSKTKIRMQKLCKIKEN